MTRKEIINLLEFCLVEDEDKYIVGNLKDLIQKLKLKQEKENGRKREKVSS